MGKTTWTEDERRIMSELYETHSRKEIAEKLGKTEASIKRASDRLGLRKSTQDPIVTGDEFDGFEVISDTVKISSKDNRWRYPKVLCRCLHCGGEKYIRVTDLRHGNSKSCGCMRDKFAGDAIRKHHHDEYFFDKWSRDMAYILGFITADGNVCEGQLRITLKEDDVEVLTYIKNCLQYTGPIRAIKTHYIHKGERKWTRAKILSIWSTYIVARLTDYHVIPSKTGREKMPEIPDEFFGDYLRGVFDGDGCIYKDRSSLMGFSICSASIQFLDALQKRTGLGTIQNSKLPSDKPFFVWAVKHSESLNMRGILYADEPFALARKKEKFFGEFRDLKNKPWGQDSDFVVDNYHSMTIREISRHIGRSEKATRTHANRLGLRRKVG